MTIGFQVSGYGPTRLLLLHGWLSDRCVFDTVLPWFDEAQFTIARMDYRGYGLSRHLKGNHTIDEIAGDALQLAKKLGWEKFHVLGHSM
ncbi:MAG TPA: alpha/beta hydrolase, partial [Rhizobiales bacterium]|nr:alpha/beta hydrolase [Hyphomicrobiales bacterium]